jgi:hypothetical protein
MTIRTSFVEHFGEENAVRVEEAALAHLAEGPFPHLDVHADDKWGPDPFGYLFLVCIGRDCFTRWRKWHKMTPEYEEILAWALEHANLHEFEGDLPDYMAMLAGAYNPWINWERAGSEEPEHTDDFRARNIEWAHASDVEFAAMRVVDMENLRMALEKGMELMNPHTGEGPLES